MKKNVVRLVILLASGVVNAGKKNQDQKLEKLFGNNTNDLNGAYYSLLVAKENRGKINFRQENTKNKQRNKQEKKRKIK